MCHRDCNDSVCFDILLGVTGSHMPEVREITPFGRGESTSQVPGKVWLLPNHQKSSCSPGGAHHGYLDCFVGMENWSFL